MGIIIASKEEIDEYYAHSGVNQTSLKWLLKGRKNYIDNLTKEGIEPSEALKIGSAVDTILTSLKKDFDKQFYVSELKNLPSDNIKYIVDMVIEELENNNIEIDLPLESYKDQILIAAADIDYGQKWKEETRINKVIEGGKEYFDDRIKSKGKIILSKEQKGIVDSVVLSLSSNERTKEYFHKEDISSKKDLVGYFQKAIYFDYEGVEGKVLLDMLFVEIGEDNKKYITPIDLKTMSGETVDFFSSMKKFGYHIQAAWYLEAVKKWAEKQYPEGNYVIRPFTFIVESTTNRGTPLVFECDDTIITVGKYGLPTLEQKLQYGDNKENLIPVTIAHEKRGLISLLSEWKYYNKNGWDIDKIIRDNPKVITLTWK